MDTPRSFLQDSKKSSKLVGLLDKVSVTMRGLATLVLVDCGDAAKLCKKLKVTSSTVLQQILLGSKLYNKY